MVILKEIKTTYAPGSEFVGLARSISQQWTPTGKSLHQFRKFVILILCHLCVLLCKLFCSMFALVQGLLPKFSTYFVESVQLLVKAISHVCFPVHMQPLINVSLAIFRCQDECKFSLPHACVITSSHPSPFHSS